MSKSHGVHMPLQIVHTIEHAVKLLSHTLPAHLLHQSFANLQGAGKHDFRHVAQIMEHLKPTLTSSRPACDLEGKIITIRDAAW